MVKFLSTIFASSTDKVREYYCYCISQRDYLDHALFTLQLLCGRATAHSICEFPKYANDCFGSPKRLPRETFELSSPLALCSQCGSQFLAASHAPLQLFSYQYFS